MNKIKMTIISGLEKVFLFDNQKKEIYEDTVFSGEIYNFQLVLTHNCDTVFEGQLQIKSQYSEYISIRKVGYVPSLLPLRENHDDYVLSEKPGLYPDVLRNINVNHLVLQRGINHTFFISVNTKFISDKNVSIRFLLKCGNSKFYSKYFKLNIISATLPESDIVYTNWFHYDSFINIHRLRLFTKKFYSIFDKYLRLATDKGMNMLMVPIFTPPLDIHKGGKRKTAQLISINEREGIYSFNFSKLDYFLDFIQKRGIKYYEFPPLFTQWGAEATPYFKINRNGRQIYKFGWKTEALSEEYKNFLRCFLQALDKYIIEKNIKSKCFFHISDEPNDKSIERYNKIKNFINENISDINILDAIRDHLTLDKQNINYPVMGIDKAYINEDNKSSNIYFCWNHQFDYLTNRFFAMPLERTAVIGMQMYLNDAKLLLHWGYNFYNDYLSYNAINPYFVTDADGIFPSGDCFIVYPDIENDSVNSSIRLEALHFGFYLYRMLKKLESLTSKTHVKNMLKHLDFEGYTKYPRYNNWMSEVKEHITNEIIKYSNM